MLIVVRSNQTTGSNVSYLLMNINTLIKFFSRHREQDSLLPDDSP